MRTVLLLIMMVAAHAVESVFGIWKLDTTRSTPQGGIQPTAITVRIDPHAKGEVFTLDRIEADGRSISSSTILYFDGAPHDFQDSRCSGTQSSRRLDSRTIEIARTCASGDSSTIVRRLAGTSKELTFDITDHHPDGRTFEQRLVLEKQSAVANSMNSQQR
jgi:hypothetical protein